jgi:hypothetical protein
MTSPAVRLCSRCSVAVCSGWSVGDTREGDPLLAPANKMEGCFPTFKARMGRIRIGMTRRTRNVCALTAWSSLRQHRSEAENFSVQGSPTSSVFTQASRRSSRPFQKRALWGTILRGLHVVQSACSDTLEITRRFWNDEGRANCSETAFRNAKPFRVGFVLTLLRIRSHQGHSQSQGRRANAQGSAARGSTDSRAGSDANRFVGPARSSDPLAH